MNANYYFIERNSRKTTEEHNEQVKRILQDAIDQLKDLGCESPEEVLRTIDWQLELTEPRMHIGKRIVGWRPLFIVSEYFESVREMKKWYMDNKDDYIIEDDHMNELSWLEFENELIGWKGKNTHFRKHSRHKEYFLDKDGYEWTSNLDNNKVEAITLE